ncbi:hypothetical protein BD410DRAFT_827861 [Rickenella mellea]|uniref:Uncharacterized protein n=1 Tax=Rickenella mellea TaxID=50990 RepID=A0A4Y7Q6S9_9AGAM|nr:hypothetical protein BD410DRAFT_827861 [Rickenella mellea]
MPNDKSAVHSLPSFAQAFRSLNSDDNALPPIQRRPSPLVRAPQSQPYRERERQQQPRYTLSSVNAKKRPRSTSNASRDDDGYSSSETSSPRAAFVKEEQDFDQLDPSPPPPPSRSKSSIHRHDPPAIAVSSSTGAPPPSLTRPQQAAKRRRVTISGLNTNNLSPSTTSPGPQPGHAQPAGAANPNNVGAPASGQPPTGPSTPISPVVMGFTIEPHNPQKFEQVRAMLSVKQRQKALIESRRGSTAGLGIGPGNNSQGLGPAAPDHLARRGSAAGMIEGRRGSMSAVNVLVQAAPSSSTTLAPNQAPPKRSGNSPNGGGRRLTTSMAIQPITVPSSVIQNTSPEASGPTGAVSPHQHIIVPSQNPRPHRSPNLQTISSVAHSQNPDKSPKLQLHASAQSQGLSAQAQAQTQAQQAQLASQGLSGLANALPPPPTSFTRRRAGQLSLRGNKPADIVISPRDTEDPATKPATGSNPNANSNALGQQRPVLRAFSYKSLQPAVQSAPPIPRNGEQPGRFPMSIPTLPPAIGQQGVSIRKTATKVPPTPTRLGMQRSTSGTGANVRLSQPTATGLSTAVPPQTPATLHRPTHSPTDKAAFLAPFEAFYDALTDAHVLKGWFGEQLGHVGRLVREIEAQKVDIEKSKAEIESQRVQVEKMIGGALGARGEVESWVSEAVERQLGSHREEMAWLRRRVEELEGMLSPKDSKHQRGQADSDEKHSTAAPSKGVNGMQSSQESFDIAPDVEMYKFPPEQPTATTHTPRPPPQPIRRSSSPARMSGSQQPPSPSSRARSQASSPAPPSEPGRRMSVSAIRYEPQLSPQLRADRITANEGSSGARGLVKSPSVRHAMAPPLRPSSSHSEHDNNGREKEKERPNIRRYNSQNGVRNSPSLNGDNKLGSNDNKHDSGRQETAGRPESGAPSPPSSSQIHPPMEET